FEVTLEQHDAEPATLAAGARPRIVCGPPAELDGSDAWWSPEHLLVAAMASCFEATFHALAKRARVHVGSLSCHARGTLAKGETAIAFSGIELRVEMRVLPDDVARAKRLVDDAKKRCFVSNSLLCPIDVVAEVSSA